MSKHCCAGPAAPAASENPHYRRALWIALFINAAMFAIELLGAAHADSASLLADAVDFFGDASNYAISLAVLSMGALWRSRAAMMKGLCMGAFGVFVLGRSAWSITAGIVPEAATMGGIGALALCANLAVAMLLYAYRSGDANMRSVWLCTRNDAIGNLAVMLAALGVFGTGGGWPDWLVAALMGALALSASWTVVRAAHREMQDVATQRTHRHAAHPH